jgi:hypothetical protein
MWNILRVFVDLTEVDDAIEQKNVIARFSTQKCKGK